MLILACFATTIYPRYLLHYFSIFSPITNNTINANDEIRIPKDNFKVLGARLDKSQQTWYNFNQKNVQEHFENPDKEDHHQVPKGSISNTFKVLRVRKAQNQPMKFWEEAIKSESVPDNLEDITEEPYGEVQDSENGKYVPVIRRRVDVD